MTARDISKISYWVENYGNAGLPDKRALEDFVLCETRELVNAFQLQLSQAADGNFPPDVIDRIIGGKRISVHGSAAEWARVMLLWLAPMIKGS